MLPPVTHGRLCTPAASSGQRRQSRLAVGSTNQQIGVAVDALRGVFVVEVGDRDAFQDPGLDTGTAQRVER